MRTRIQKAGFAAPVLAAALSAALLAADQPRSTIALASTRHDGAIEPANLQRGYNALEMYLMDGDGSNVRRITDNAHFDGFPAVSPDGRRIVFDSNRLRAEGEPLNVSDLFVMNADGRAKGTRPKNITNDPATIDDDPDWSPRGGRILFTSHQAAGSSTTDDHPEAEIYVIDAAGAAPRTRLTTNAEEERGPSWSPDGKMIVFNRIVAPAQFQLFVINADGSGRPFPLM